MLSNDNTILNILLNAKKQGNRLLQHFHIAYPNKQLAEENNTILVAVVSSENRLDGFDFEEFTDLVEILIVTKHKDNQKAIKIIKAISYEICRLIMVHKDQFPNKPVIRNINPYFDTDLILNRGQIMIQVVTEPVDFNITPETIEDVCKIITENIEESI